MTTSPQLDLFAPRVPAPDPRRASTPETPPYQPRSETSRQAAERIAPDAGTIRARVLSYIEAQGEEGVTDEQIIDALALSPSTGRPRRVELVASGHVIDSGRTRPTKAGRQATVWVAR